VIIELSALYNKGLDDCVWLVFVTAGIRGLEHSSSTETLELRDQKELSSHRQLTWLPQEKSQQQILLPS